MPGKGFPLLAVRKLPKAKVNNVIIRQSDCDLSLMDSGQNFKRNLNPLCQFELAINGMKEKKSRKRENKTRKYFFFNVLRKKQQNAKEYKIAAIMPNSSCC